MLGQLLLGAINFPTNVMFHIAPNLRDHDPHYGFTPTSYALIFGILSGTSMPIAAWIGVSSAPEDNDETPRENKQEFEQLCALMMAFGAGALLFAVTVELYGHALHQVDEGTLGLDEMFTIIFGALCGGAFYLTVSRWLDKYLSGETDEDAEKGSIADDMKKQDEDADKKKRSGSQLWAKAKSLVIKPKLQDIIRQVHTEKKLKARQQALITAAGDVQHAKSVALALFLGLLVDGVPEGVLMGFLSAEGHLTPVLIISLFVANFPEAFSSASLLKKAKMSNGKIIGMWAGLCLLVGCMAGLSCFILLYNFPNFGKPGHADGHKLPVEVLIGISLVEGVTGGSMIACISSVMLPEAFEGAGKAGPFWSQSGFLCLSGFLMSAAMKATFG